jgi:drug/metabolite transporter (DMT)-like permease
VSSALLQLAEKAEPVEIERQFSATGWIWIACLAVISTVVAMLAFYAGLARTGPSTACILCTLEPVVTTALAALMLQDILTPVQLVGGVLVLCSVAVVQLQMQPDRIERPPIRPSEPGAHPAEISQSSTSQPLAPVRAKIE